LGFIRWSSSVVHGIDHNGVIAVRPFFVVHQQARQLWFQIGAVERRLVDEIHVHSVFGIGS